jgi:hypothetical protein
MRKATSKGKRKVAVDVTPLRRDEIVLRRAPEAVRGRPVSVLGDGEAGRALVMGQ